MFKYLRKNLKIIMWVIIGAFVITIFFSWGMGGIQEKKSLAAKINGKKITINEYNDVLKLYYRYVENSYGKNLTPELLKSLNIEKMAMEQLITNTLIDQKTKEMGVTVSDEEVINYFKGYKDFQTDGKFDPRKFAILNNPRALRPDFNWTQQEKQIRQDILRNKFENILKDGVHVSDKEVEFKYLYENEEIKVHYISVNPKEFLTEEKIKNYYKQNIKRFEEPEKVRVSHILFLVKNNDINEESKVRKHAEDVLAEIKKGKDFEKAVKEYSEDAMTKDKAGDLDYVQKGVMDGIFEKTVFELKTGEISSVIRSEYGYHIIKATGRKSSRTKSFDEVKENINELAVTDEERNKAKEKAQKVNEYLSQNKNLEKTASEFKISLKSSEYFNRSKFVPEINEIKNEAFKLSVGETSPMIEKNSKFYFAKLLERKTVDLEKFVQKKDELKKEMFEQKRYDAFNKWLDDVRKKSQIEILQQI